MVQRTGVQFEVDGGVLLHGWLFVHERAGRRPAITETRSVQRGGLPRPALDSQGR